MEEVTLTVPEFNLFRRLIYRHAGISLADGKRQMVQARLRKRLQHYGFQQYQPYYDLLKTQPASSPEMVEFTNCITTNKTDFYREPHHFQFVAEHIIPEMQQAVSVGRIPARMRIWHAGCSTGEEPYTLAMTLQETLGSRNTWDIRQLASDIDTNVLAFAEAGIYDSERIGPIPERLLKRYFLSGTGEMQGSVRVRSELREQIKFRQINLLADLWPIRPEVRFDIIFCRNVIIYFDREGQRKVFARYAKLLRPGGYLFIGHSETLLGVSEAFEPIGKTTYKLRDSVVEY